MQAGGYRQVDETPVKVLDPDVRGKAAPGYLWSYAVPGGDVLTDFDSSRGLGPVRRRLADFAGTIETEYEVYESLHRQANGIVRIRCLAHARRPVQSPSSELLAGRLVHRTDSRALPHRG